ncbi:hypothetical protein Clacol_009496 [Clathrus columnatus]|uniref:Uncharacterized protein n=1 Tax=Clathrus columnatus TaxID=1419009 RepID=A0AAV5ATJ1_9AGAM|nr:hypothetical protein Clacol_009496 [Clathrus columnatus]
MLDYCTLCGRPFEDVQQQWIREVSYWIERLAKGEGLNFIPPPLPTEDIVNVSDKDVCFWLEFVCVGPLWKSSSLEKEACDDNIICSTIGNDFGSMLFDGPFPPEDDNAYLAFHHGCLSFLCRRLNVFPKQIWDSFFSEGSDYLAHTETRTGLLRDLEYYDANQFHGEEPYQYCLVKITPRRDGKEGDDVWSDPEPLEPLRWILMRPDIFPASRLEEELKAEDVFTPSSVIQGTKDIFSLLQVNRDFYTAIVQDRQNIFLRLSWMHGWMLPSTPRDWDNWTNGAFHNGSVLEAKDNQDWRAYLLVFLRKKNVHVKSRWRLHRMVIQFGRGRSEVKDDDGKTYRWRFPVGELAFRADVKPKEVWEFGRRGKYEQKERYQRYY